VIFEKNKQYLMEIDNLRGLLEQERLGNLRSTMQAPAHVSRVMNNTMMEAPVTMERSVAPFGKKDRVDCF
jgi:hypothetical protein